MESPARSESEHPRALSAGDRSRKQLLQASSGLLVVALGLIAVFFSDAFKNPMLMLGAFLLAFAQTALAIVYLDSIRSFLPAERRSFLLEMLASALSFVIISLVCLAQASSEVSFLITCVFIVWGAMFETALGPAFRLQLVKILCGSAAYSVAGMMRNGCVPCVSLILIPISLGTGIIWFGSCFLQDVDK